MNRPRGRRVHLPVLAILLLSTIVLAGCDLDAWREEYRGEDLIADRGFSAASFTGSYIAGATPLFNYVNYVEIADSAVYGDTTGLPTTPGSIYRLELVNLLPNGDFEGTAAAATPAGWTLDAVTFQGDETPGDAITGMSAYFDVTGTAAAYFDLRAGLLDLLVYPGTYHLNLRLRRATDVIRVNFDYGSLSASVLALNGINWQSDAVDASRPVEEFPNDTNIDVINIFPIEDDTEHYLYIGAPNDAAGVFGQQGHIDDVRIGRYDILPHVALSLGAAVSDGSLDILPGAYRFSVYVKSEIDSQVTPDTGNAFRPGQITLGINDSWDTTTMDDAAWSSSEWVQVSCEALLRSDDLAETDAVTLRLTVSSNENPMVGRILIAAPIFELVVQ